MTRIITAPWDHLLYKLMELTECDAIDWFTDPFDLYSEIMGLNMNCRIEWSVISYVFKFEEIKIKEPFWKLGPLYDLWCTVQRSYERQQKKIEEEHRQALEAKIQQIMEIKCEE